jgi:hypothetical protein
LIEGHKELWYDGYVSGKSQLVVKKGIRIELLGIDVILLGIALSTNN